MTATIAAIIWGVSLIAWVAIRIPRRLRAKKAAVIDNRKSTLETSTLAFCIIGLAVVPIIHLLTGLFGFANYTFIPALGYLGTLAMVGFLMVFFFSHKHLAKNWSVTLEIRENHELIQHGIYSRIRHPMYTSFWLWGIGQALLIPNWIAGPVGLLSIAILYFSRIKNEEAMMREQFGQAYDDYCAKTGRLIPATR